LDVEFVQRHIGQPEVLCLIVGKVEVQEVKAEELLVELVDQAEGQLGDLHRELDLDVATRQQTEVEVLLVVLRALVLQVSEQVLDIVADLVILRVELVLDRLDHGLVLLSDVALNLAFLRCGEEEAIAYLLGHLRLNHLFNLVQLQLPLVFVSDTFMPLTSQLQDLFVVHLVLNGQHRCSVRLLSLRELFLVLDGVFGQLVGCLEVCDEGLKILVFLLGAQFSLQEFRLHAVSELVEEANELNGFEEAQYLGLEQRDLGRYEQFCVLPQ